MAIRNPYSEYARSGEDGERQALLDALDEPEPLPPPMQARPRTPVRTPQQTREMLEGPGGRTQVIDRTRETEDNRDLTNAFSDDVSRPYMDNGFSGDRWEDERQEPDVYQPPTQTPAQPQAGGTTHPSNTQRGYQLMDEYDDGYARRNEGSGGALSNGATWAQRGASIGSVVPGVGTLVGGVVGGLAGLIAGAFTKNAESARTDFSINDARAIISQAHKDAFGRDITPEYLDQILQGQGWRPGHKWFGEGPLAYVLDQFASQAPADRAETAAANAAAANQGAAETPAGAATGAPPYAMEGFDLQRAQDPSFSVKDAFAAAVRQAPEPPPGEDKAALGEWFKKYAQPFIEAQGHKVNWIEGDKVNITGPQGTGTTDWYRGAGAAGGALAWQPEDGGGTAGSGGVNGTSGATSIHDAYAWLKQNADPSWTREQMQAAINAAFADVPGFVEGYAGDAVFKDGKLDLITNFEGPGANWSDNLSLIPLHAAGGTAGVVAGGGATTGGPNLAPGVQLAAPLGRSDVLAQIQAELDRLLRGEPPRDELLEALN
jgi:hypothetical protein